MALSGREFLPDCSLFEKNQLALGTAAGAGGVAAGAAAGMAPRFPAGGAVPGDTGAVVPGTVAGTVPGAAAGADVAGLGATVVPGAPGGVAAGFFTLGSSARNFSGGTSCQANSMTNSVTGIRCPASPSASSFLG